ncbi:hypothetical protein RI367_000490 [Sorochytrium milnesiophthora]
MADPQSLLDLVAPWATGLCVLVSALVVTAVATLLFLWAALVSWSPLTGAVVKPSLLCASAQVSSSTLLATSSAQSIHPQRSSSWPRRLQRLAAKTLSAFLFGSPYFPLVVPAVLLLFTTLYLALTLVVEWHKLAPATGTALSLGSSIALLYLRFLCSFAAQTAGELCLLWKTHTIYGNHSLIRRRVLLVSGVLCVLRMVAQIMHVQARAALEYETAATDNPAAAAADAKANFSVRRQAQYAVATGMILDVFLLLNILFVTMFFVYRYARHWQKFKAALSQPSTPIPLSPAPGVRPAPLQPPSRQSPPNQPNNNAQVAAGGGVDSVVGLNALSVSFPSAWTSALLMVVQHSVIPAVLALALCIAYPFYIGTPWSTPAYNVKVYIDWLYKCTFAVFVTYATYLLHLTMIDYQRAMAGSGVPLKPTTAGSSSPFAQARTPAAARASPEVNTNATPTQLLNTLPTIGTNGGSAGVSNEQPSSPWAALPNDLLSYTYTFSHAYGLPASPDMAPAAAVSAMTPDPQGPIVRSPSAPMSLNEPLPSLSSTMSGPNAAARPFPLNHINTFISDNAGEPALSPPPVPQAKQHRHHHHHHQHQHSHLQSASQSLRPSNYDGGYSGSLEAAAAAAAGANASSEQEEQAAEMSQRLSQQQMQHSSPDLLIAQFIRLVKEKFGCLVVLVGWEESQQYQPPAPPSAESSPSLSDSAPSSSNSSSPLLPNGMHSPRVRMHRRKWNWSLEHQLNTSVITEHTTIDIADLGKWTVGPDGAPGSPQLDPDSIAPSSGGGSGDNLRSIPRRSAYSPKQQQIAAIQWWVMHVCKHRPSERATILTHSDDVDAVVNDWTSVLSVSKRAKLASSLSSVSGVDSSDVDTDGASTGRHNAREAAAVSKHLKQLLRTLFTRVKEVVCVPIRFRGSVVGAVYLENQEVCFRNNAQSLDLLLKICKHFGICHINARLFKQLEHLNSDLEKRVLDRTSQLQLMTQKAEESAKAKTMFLANMSHEIRTPAAQVIQAANLLAETQLTDEQVDHVHIIRSAGEQLLALLNDVLDFSKLEHGKIRFENRPYQLIDAVHSSIDTFTIQGKDVDLAYYIDKALPELVIGDVTRVRQIFNNLISNAIKFTDSGSVLFKCEVVKCLGQMQDPDATEPSQGPTVAYDVTFSVTDTGVGIPQEKLSVIFERFEQSDASITRRFGGTGLGLSICMSLCQLMKSKIHVTSQTNHGSCFFFTLRVYAPNPANIPPSLMPPVSTLVTQRMVLRTRHAVLLTPADQHEDQVLLAQLESYFASVRTVSFPLSATSLADAQCSLAHLQMQLAQDGDVSVFVISCPVWLAAPATQPPPTPVPVLFVSRAAAEDMPPSSYSAVEFMHRPYKQSQLLRALLRLTDTTSIAPCETPTPSSPTRTISTITSLQSSPAPATIKPAQDDAVQRPPPEIALNVMVVDDNPINRRMMRQTMKILGIQADLAENGQEAVDKATANNYDIIFMDVRMPVMDGLEATRLIREHFGHPLGAPFDVPHNRRSSGYMDTVAARPGPLICGLSADAMDENEKTALASGMDTYIRKPLLKADASRILDQVKALRQLQQQQQQQQH